VLGMPHCGDLVELGGVLFKLDGVAMIVSDPQVRRPTAVYGRIHISPWSLTIPCACVRYHREFEAEVVAENDVQVVAQ
jgi:hypothetical protein